MRMVEDMQERFLRDGVVFPVDVFSPEEAAGLRGKFSEYVRRYGSCKEGQVRRIRGNRIFRVHLLAKWARDIVTNPRLVSAVCGVLGTTDLLVWSSDLTVKPANSSECFGWHQDEAYADLGPEDKLATAWVALSPTTKDNGCVRFLAGSQRSGSLPHASLQRTSDRNLVLGQVVPEGRLPAGCREVQGLLEPGQASLHGWRTVHSSWPNTSGEDRVGLAIRYMSAEVRQARPVVQDRVSLVTGRYAGDWFEVESWPSGEYGPGEWAEHRKSMERE